MKMNNQEKLEAIKEWQSDDMIHPLTCGNNSNHRNLIGEEIDGKIILKCLDCNYIQNWVPEIVFEYKHEIY
jgi:hypothetical protein